jgi:hypothetical protein
MEIRRMARIVAKSRLKFSLFFLNEIGENYIYVIFNSPVHCIP